jgi:hypothetical protein
MHGYVSPRTSVCVRTGLETPIEDRVASFDKETQKKYFSVMQIALGNMIFVNDLLDIAVMDVYDELQKAKIYKHRRKQQMKPILAEVAKYEKVMINRYAEQDDFMSERNDAFGSAVAHEQFEALNTMKAEMERLGFPNTTYLAKLHQAFIISSAACSIVDVWTKRVRNIIPYRSAPYSFDHLRPTFLFDKLRLFAGEEFGAFGDVDAHMEGVIAADDKFIARLCNTDVVCKVMCEGHEEEDDFTSVRDLLLQSEKEKVELT